MGLDEPPQIPPQETTEELPYDVRQIESSEEMFRHLISEAGLPADATVEDLDRVDEAKHLKRRQAPPGTKDEIDAAEAQEELAYQELLRKIAAEMQANGVEPNLPRELSPELLELNASIEAKAAEEFLRGEATYMVGKISNPGSEPLSELVAAWEQGARRTVSEHPGNERLSVFADFQRVRLSIAVGDTGDALRRLGDVISRIRSSSNAADMQDILEKAEFNLANTRRNVEEKQ